MVSVKSRTSRPRLTVTWRSALAWFQAEISRTPVAAGLRASARASAASRLDAGAGGVDVERDLAAEQVRRDPAEHDVGVGDGHARCRPGRSRAARGRRRPTAARP